MLSCTLEFIITALLKTQTEPVYSIVSMLGCTYITSNKYIHFEMILDVGIGEKRKETRFLI